MALSGTTNKITFTAVAGQTQFTVPSSIPFFDATTIDTANKKFGDIKVTKESAAGVITQLTPDATPADGTEFKIDATNGDPAQGCVVTIGAGATLNDKYTVERDVAYTQEYDLQGGATIDPTALNKALDRVVAQNQQQNDEFTRTITFPVTDADSITYNVDTSATDRAGKLLGFDSSGNVTELAQISGSASVDTSRGLQLVNNQVGVKDDGITNAFIANDAVDTAQIADDAVEQAQIADNAVGTSQIANGAITKAKIEDVTNMRVLGNTSGSDSAPQEVSVLDEDDMDSNDAEALATQQSIKAYVDNEINLYKPNINQTVVSATKSSTSTSFADITDLNVAITPKFSNSKIRVTAMLNATISGDDIGLIQTFRDTTQIALGDTAGSRSRVTFQIEPSDNQHIVCLNLDFLDSPNTTDEITYKFKWKVSTNDTIYLNRSYTDSDTDDYGRTISTITAEEIYQ